MEDEFIKFINLFSNKLNINLNYDNKLDQL